MTLKASVAIPANLNKPTQRKYFQLFTTEEIFADMHSAKYFPKIDASNGFLQIPVDKNSLKLKAGVSDRS